MLTSMLAAEVEGEGDTGHVPAAADMANVDANALQDIDFDDGWSSFPAYFGVDLTCA
jgi:hypothetical protein